jgi:hypothetical protein
MPVALNPQGQAVRLDESGQWVPTRTAKNPDTGQTLILDGDAWVEATTGAAPAPQAAPQPPQAVTPAPPLAGMGSGGGDVLAPDQPAFLAEAEVAREPDIPLTDPRRIGEIGRGLRQGVANMAGLPNDLINLIPMLLNLLPGEQGFGPINERAVGGREDITALMDAAGVPQGNEPKDAFGRILARGSEEVGAAAVPIPGLALASRLVAPAAKMASGKLVKENASNVLNDMFLEPFRQAPLSTAVSEAAIAAGGGTAAGVAKETVPNAGTGTDAIANLLGSFGTGGAMRVGDLAFDAGRTLMTPGSTGSKSLREAVGRDLQENMTDQEGFVGNVTRGQEVQEAVPGLKNTTGNTSGDPGLQALEFSRRNAKNAGAFRVRDTQNNQAANQALDDVAPDLLDDAPTRARLEARRDRAVGTAEGITQRRGEALESAERRTEPTQTPQQSGEDIRGGIEAERADLVGKRQAGTDPARQAAEASLVEVDTSDVFKTIDDKLAVDKREPVVNALKSVRKKLFKNVTDDADPEIDTTVSGLYETRKAINDLIAGRGEDSTGRFAQKELAEIRDELDKAFVKAEPEFGRFLEDFRELSKPINALDEGATGQVLKKNKLTETPDVPASAVPGKFFKAGDGSPEAIQEFTAKVGGRAEAVKGLRQFALADARKAFEAGGEKGLRKWLDKYESALSAFPEVRRDLSDVASAKSAFDRAARREKMLKEGLSNPRQSTIAKYLDADDAATSMKAILTAKNPRREMANLVRLIRGDKDALEGAKRAFWDNFVQRNPNKPKGVGQSQTEDLTGTPFLLPGKLKQYTRANGDALEVLYRDDPAQLKRIRKIADAVSQGQQTAKARPPGQSGTALAQRNVTVPGLTVAGFASRGFAIARGVVSIEYIAAETALRHGKRVIAKIKRKQYEELLDRALLDPEVAKTLVMEVNQSNANVIGRRLRLHLGNAVSKGLTDNEKDE